VGYPNARLWIKNHAFGPQTSVFITIFLLLFSFHTYMIGVVCIGMPYPYFEDYIRWNLVGRNYTVIRDIREMSTSTWVFQGVFVINQAPRSYWSMAPPVPHYLINMEQCSNKDHLSRLLKEMSGGRYSRLIDYSEANVRWSGIEETTVVRMKRNISPRVQGDDSKEYDVAFVGLLNARRNHVLQSLVERGASVRHVRGWGRNRDKEISKARVLINIHYSENYLVFESIRCLPWMGREDIVVISEDSEPDGLTPWVFTCAYDDLVQSTLDALSEPEGFRRDPPPADTTLLTDVLD